MMTRRKQDVDETNLLVKVTAIREFTDAALRRYLPPGRDDDWLASTVDPPRFGWDWPALEDGFLGPFHAWAAAHPSRARSVLAALLIDALGGDYRRHGCELAALEIRHIGSVMLEACHNGRDLSESASTEIAIPMPVWVTIAYNARQLATVLVFRHATGLSGDRRYWLGRRFAQSLWHQGIGATLNLWGAQCGSPHASIEDFVTYLRWYVGPLTFALACDVASAASSLTAASADFMARAGMELGVSVRLADMVDSKEHPAQVSPLGEQRISWIGGVDLDAAGRQRNAVTDAAFSWASQASPAAPQAFEAFLRVLGTPLGPDATPC